MKNLWTRTVRATCALLVAAATLVIVTRADVLPEDRADFMYHRYEGGGVTVEGPSVLVRGKTRFLWRRSIGATLRIVPSRNHGPPAPTRRSWRSKTLSRPVEIRFLMIFCGFFAAGRLAATFRRLRLNTPRQCRPSLSQRTRRNGAAPGTGSSLREAGANNAIATFHVVVAP